MNFFIRNIICLTIISPAVHATTVILGDTSGNTRGTNAVDIQSARGSVTNIASGAQAIAIGAYSRVAGSDAVGIGNSNTVDGVESFGLGQYNEIYGPWALAVGMGNQVSALQWVYDYYQHTPSGAFGAFNVITPAGDASYTFGGWNTVGAASATAFGNGISNSTPNSTMIGPSDTAKVTILSSGFVGIGLGANSPAQALDVGGNIRLSGNIIKAGANGGTLTIPNGNGTLVTTNGNQTIVGTTTMGGSSAAQQTKIDGVTGSVGIGITTASPTAKLDVNGDAKVATTLTVNGDATLNANLTVNGLVTKLRLAPQGDIDMGIYNYTFPGN